MNLYSGRNQSGACPARAVGVALLVGALVFTGCGKAKSPAVDAPAAEVVKPAAKDHVPVYAPAPAKVQAAAVAAPNNEPDLAVLDRALLRWLMSNRRKPASFEDFAATAGVTIPPAPAGKKYVIAKDMHIHLVGK